MLKVTKLGKVVKREYVIVRSANAGVFAGYLESRNGQEITLTNARRIWYWKGAATLSQLAMQGTSRPQECRFPMAVERVDILKAEEVLYVSPEAKMSIEAVPTWSA